MIDMHFEKRVRTAARASVDAVPVPAVPESLRRLRAGVPQRYAARWFWPAAAAAAVTLTLATDGGRAAFAYAVEHTVKVFSIDPDTGRRAPASTISMREALLTPAFRVVVPRGLPAGTRLVSVQRLGDPETGRPSVLFHYALGGRPFEILETALTTDGAPDQVVRTSSSALPEPHGAIVAPKIAVFGAGRTQVTVSAAPEALSDAQMIAIRKAMTGR